MFLTPVGLYIFVHPVVFLVHDPYKHVGWFFALQKAPIKKMPNPPPLIHSDVVDTDLRLVYSSLYSRYFLGTMLSMSSLIPGILATLLSYQLVIRSPR